MGGGDWQARIAGAFYRCQLQSSLEHDMSALPSKPLPTRYGPPTVHWQRVVHRKACKNLGKTRGPGSRHMETLASSIFTRRADVLLARLSTTDMSHKVAK